MGNRNLLSGSSLLLAGVLAVAVIIIANATLTPRGFACSGGAIE